MLIWIEHEVWVLDQQKALQKALLTAHPADKYNMYKEHKPWLSVAYDKEYYNTQYEVKFKGFDPTLENIEEVAKYFGLLYGKHESIQNKWPDFVGTHIHLFNNYWPNNKGLIYVMERVFKEMAWFWKKFYEDDRIAYIYKLYELKRLSTSNNLLKFLDHNIMFWRLREILDYSCQAYQYKDIWYDRPKYAPVIWSHARWGKEYSLELRYISNTYYLLEDPINIRNMVVDCQNIVNQTTINPIENTEELKAALKSILSSYHLITCLSYGIQNNLSLRDVEERIRKSLSLTTVDYDENRLRLISEVNMSMISDSDIFERSRNIQRGNIPPEFWQDEWSDDWGDEQEYDDDDSEEENS